MNMLVNTNIPAHLHERNSNIMKYFDELTRAMEWLAAKSNTIFISQSCKYPGTAIYNTLKNVNDDKKIEFPVDEHTQTGFVIGMSLNGFIPISCYPRHNFLLAAYDQLINNADKLPLLSSDSWQPHVIIRVGVGHNKPLNPGEQHLSNFSDAIRSMAKTIKVVDLYEPEQIMENYQEAYYNKRVTILTEFHEFYSTK